MSILVVGMALGILGAALWAASVFVKVERKSSDYDKQTRLQTSSVWYFSDGRWTGVRSVSVVREVILLPGASEWTPRSPPTGTTMALQRAPLAHLIRVNVDDVFRFPQQPGETRGSFAGFAWMTVPGNPADLPKTAVATGVNVLVFPAYPVGVVGVLLLTTQTAIYLRRRNQRRRRGFPVQSMKS